MVKPPAARSSPSSSAWRCIPTDPGLADIHASSALHSMVCPILDDALWVQLTAGDVSRYRTTYVCNQYWIQSTSTQSTTLQCPRASGLQLHRLFNVLSARLRLQAKYYTEQGPLRSDAKRLIEVHIYRNMEDDVRIQVDKLNLENSINPRKKSEVDSGSPRSTNNANMGTSSNFSPFATHLRQQCSIPLWP